MMKADRVTKFFEFLGISPNTIFKVKQNGEVNDNVYYYFKENMTLYFRVVSDKKDWSAVTNSEAYKKLVTGEYEIVEVKPIMAEKFVRLVDDIFMTLGITPKEEFMIRGLPETLFRINEDLTVDFQRGSVWKIDNNPFTLPKILTGEYEIYSVDEKRICKAEEE